MDPTVYFIKEDEVFGRIQCDDFDFTILLREKFSFFAEGYRFHPRYKAKQWDGKIRLLDTSGRIYLGLWSEVLKFCKEQNHPCKIDPKLHKKELPFEKLEAFVDRLNVHSGGESITPRDYQVQGVHKALEFQKCILLSPTSSGKSLIQYILSRMYENLINDRILIVVPTVALVTQMIDDFCDYSSEIEWDGQKMMHGIRGGVSKETDKHIIVSTYQSLAKVDKSFFTQFGALMVDECLSGETLISTPSGLVPIKNIKEGDEVYSFTEDGNEFIVDRVIKVHKNLLKSQSQKMLRLTLEDGSFLDITSNHKLLTERGWVEAGDITIDDEIIDYGTKYTQD